MLRPFRAEVAFCRDSIQAFSLGWYVRALQALFKTPPPALKGRDIFVFKRRIAANRLRARANQFMLRPFRAEVAFCQDFTQAFSLGWYVRALQALFENAVTSPEGAPHTSPGLKARVGRTLH